MSGAKAKMTMAEAVIERNKLRDKSLKELIKIARQNGIDLSRVSEKEEIVQLLVNDDIIDAQSVSRADPIDLDEIPPLEPRDARSSPYVVPHAVPPSPPTVSHTPAKTTNTQTSKPVVPISSKSDVMTEIPEHLNAPVLRPAASPVASGSTSVNVMPAYDTKPIPSSNVKDIPSPPPVVHHHHPRAKYLRKSGEFSLLQKVKQPRVLKQFRRIRIADSWPRIRLERELVTREEHVRRLRDALRMMPASELRSLFARLATESKMDGNPSYETFQLIADLPDDAVGNANLASFVEFSLLRGALDTLGDAASGMYRVKYNSCGGDNKPSSPSPSPQAQPQPKRQPVTQSATASAPVQSKQTEQVVKQAPPSPSPPSPPSTSVGIRVPNTDPNRKIETAAPKRQSEPSPNSMSNGHIHDVKASDKHRCGHKKCTVCGRKYDELDDVTDLASNLDKLKTFACDILASEKPAVLKRLLAASETESPKIAGKLVLAETWANHALPSELFHVVYRGWNKKRGVFPVMYPENAESPRPHVLAVIDDVYPEPADMQAFIAKSIREQAEAKSSSSPPSDKSDHNAPKHSDTTPNNSGGVKADVAPTVPGKRIDPVPTKPHKKAPESPSQIDGPDLPESNKSVNDTKIKHAEPTSDSSRIKNEPKPHPEKQPNVQPAVKTNIKKPVVEPVVTTSDKQTTTQTKTPKSNESTQKDVKSLLDSVIKEVDISDDLADELAEELADKFMKRAADVKYGGMPSSTSVKATQVKTSDSDAIAKEMSMATFTTFVEFSISMDPSRTISNIVASYARLHGVDVSDSEQLDNMYTKMLDAGVILPNREGPPSSEALLSLFKHDASERRRDASSSSSSVKTKDNARPNASDFTLNPWSERTYNGVKFSNLIEARNLFDRFIDAGFSRVDSHFGVSATSDDKKKVKKNKKKKTPETTVPTPTSAPKTTAQVSQPTVSQTSAKPAVVQPAVVQPVVVQPAVVQPVVTKTDTSSSTSAKQPKAPVVKAPVVKAPVIECNGCHKMIASMPDCVSVECGDGQLKMYHASCWRKYTTSISSDPWKVGMKCPLGCNNVTRICYKDQVYEVKPVPVVKLKDVEPGSDKPESSSSKATDNNNNNKKKKSDDKTTTPKLPVKQAETKPVPASEEPVVKQLPVVVESTSKTSKPVVVEPQPEPKLEPVIAPEPDKKKKSKPKKKAPEVRVEDHLKPPPECVLYFTGYMLHGVSLDKAASGALSVINSHFSAFGDVSDVILSSELVTSSCRYPMPKDDSGVDSEEILFGAAKVYIVFHSSYGVEDATSSITQVIDGQAFLMNKADGGGCMHNLNIAYSSLTGSGDDKVKAKKKKKVKQTITPSWDLPKHLRQVGPFKDAIEQSARDIEQSAAPEVPESSTPAPTPTDDTPAVLTEYEQSVHDLVSFGFNVDEARSALMICGQNATQAIEYLHAKHVHGRSLATGVKVESPMSTPAAISIAMPSSPSPSPAPPRVAEVKKVVEEPRPQPKAQVPPVVLVTPKPKHVEQESVSSGSSKSPTPPAVAIAMALGLGVSQSNAPPGFPAKPALKPVPPVTVAPPPGYSMPVSRTAPQPTPNAVVDDEHTEIHSALHLESMVSSILDVDDEVDIPNVTKSLVDYLWENE